MSSVSIDTVQACIKDVRAWRTLRLKQSKSLLRSEELEPPGYTTLAASTILVHDWMWEAFGFVAQARRQRLIGDTDGREAVASDGRLLLWSGENNMNDGLARDHSGGFFDCYNLPPWDLWVAYAHRIDEAPAPNPLWNFTYLISWIPPEEYCRVDRGIQSNAENCILWIEDAEKEFPADFAKLRRYGLVTRSL